MTEPDVALLFSQLKSRVVAGEETQMERFRAI